MRRKQALLLSAAVLIVVLITSGIYLLVRMDTEESEKLGVAVTIPPQKEFAERIGGDRVEVVLMVPADKGDPHTSGPDPGLMNKMSAAAIYAKVGSGVEFEERYMGTLKENNPDMLIVDCSRDIELMGDDPHIWNSPRNAITMANAIYEGLREVDPGNSSYYEKNWRHYVRELEMLDWYIANMLDGYDERTFLVYHPAFAYLACDYNLTQKSVEEHGKGVDQELLDDLTSDVLTHNLSYLFTKPKSASADVIVEGLEAEGVKLEIATMDPLAEQYVYNMLDILDMLIMEFENEG